MKLYIYPTYTPSRDKSGNLYIKFFHDSFKQTQGIQLVNRIWKIGISSLLFNLDAKIVIIQWVDLIPQKKFGMFQSIALIILLKLCKIIGKKIVWILHNKRAHARESKMVDYIMKFMAKVSDDVVVHSSDGVLFFDAKYPKYAGKCRFIPHPVYNDKEYDSITPKYDYIVWGGINRHKINISFFDIVKKSEILSKRSFLLCGKCSDTILAELIKNKKGDNIDFENRFLTDEELRDRISKSRCILFLYSEDSLLSSGAVIYSINFCKPIIGPNAGNFADLTNIVSTYDALEQIQDIVFRDNKKYCMEYIKDNTWDKFPKKLLNKFL